jgi:tetratricopeptide (TPR) repeat protein
MLELENNFKTARQFTQDNDFEEAIHTYKAILSEYPLHVPSHYNLAQLAAKLGDAASAREHFETVTRLAPEFAPGYFQLAQILLVQHQPIEAMANLKQAIFCI